MDTTEDKKYSSIFKTTFLFGFVQIVSIVIAIVKSKLIAVWIGAAGVGVFSIYNTTLTFLKTGTGLGISRSAIREISEAYSCGDVDKFSREISLTKRIILLTGFLGFFITIILSPLLSFWTFGDFSNTLQYIILSVVTGISIVTEGQLAIITGMRKLKQLALANAFGALVGLFSAVPLIYFFRFKGIIPVLIIGAISSLIFSHYIVSKISYTKIRFFYKDVFREGHDMITLGLAFVLIPILSTLANLVLASYINTENGSDMLGYYHAGSTIITSYFGIMVNAMWTDYYPRLSAISSDNHKLEKECNRQFSVSLLLIFPLVVLMILFSNVILKMLYTPEFLICVAYVNFAIFGKIFDIGSGVVSYIILSKKEKLIFSSVNILHRILEVIIGILCLRKWGLMGLGISYTIIYVVIFTLQVIIIRIKYNIAIERNNYKRVLLIMSCGIVTLLLRHLPPIPQYVLGGMLLIGILLYSHHILKNEMSINLLKPLTKYLRRNQ